MYKYKKDTQIYLPYCIHTCCRAVDSMNISINYGVNVSLTVVRILPGGGNCCSTSTAY